jgi:uncharacterized membrane protein YfcA
MDIAPAELGILALCFLMTAAFFAGLIDSVAGGGGLLSIPATLLVGLPPHLALGTGKFMAAVGTTASFITYARNKAVVWRIAAIGVFFSFAGSVAGTQTALRIDNAALGKVILVLLPVAALLTFMPVRKNTREKPLTPLALYLFTPLICTAIGFYDGFFGPGTGSFMLLSLHFILGLNLIAASGTAKAFNLASNVSSLVVFLLNGKVFWLAALPMAAANVAGNIFGARMALRQGPALIRKMLFISLALLFATLIWRYYS